MGANIPNAKARHIAIATTGLHLTGTGSCNTDVLLELIKHLGYVQLDPLKVIARAHDHILWSRHNQYKEHTLHRLMTEDRQVFEHFCHDACILPMDTLPYWIKQFDRRAAKVNTNGWGGNLLGKTQRRKLMARIEQEGPLRSNDFKISSTDKSRPTWSKPAHKNTLDALWLMGELAVAKRVNFFKYYDLSHRIYPQKLINTVIDDAEKIHWFCINALQRLGFGSAGDIKRFWDTCTLPEVKGWMNESTDQLSTVTIESALGDSFECTAHKSQSSLLRNPPKPTARLRIINPFDPIVRDRKRLSQLFGFDYRIEIYTPPKKRVYGYYVYPLLEFDKFVGRIEVRHDKALSTVFVDNLWPEKNVKFGALRMQKLNAELERLRRFCNAEKVTWSG